MQNVFLSALSLFRFFYYFHKPPRIFVELKRLE